MARCPPELLDDLTDLLAEVRDWPGVLEKSAGVFYVRRTPFLHFHRQADGRRRADVKSADGWVPFELPYPISVGGRRAFRRALRRHHDVMLSTPAARRRSPERVASSRSSGRGASGRPGS